MSRKLLSPLQSDIEFHPAFSSHARFLWKRIPQNLKNPELEQLYKVFESLWHNQFTQFYVEINFNWSPNIAKIMIELKGKINIRLHLILDDNS